MTVDDRPTTFEADVSHAVGLLAAASRQIHTVRPTGHGSLAAYERLHLSTGLLLAAQRARHLMPTDLFIDEPIVISADAATQVAEAHDLLIGQLQGAEPFELLELVADVGKFCQNMRRHDRLH